MMRLARFGQLVAGVAAAMMSCATPGAADPLTVHVDYASFNPLSIVLKDKHWIEEALGDGYTVDWLPEGTTNRTLDRLRVRGIDIGASASAVTLLQKVAGTSVKIVYVYAKPNWTSLVVGAHSGINSVADLRGKRVSASIRTEPGIFLLHALADAGMSTGDIIWVPLHDLTGRLSLEQGQVDAWAGFDPYTAQAQLESGDRIFLNRPDFNSYGVLDVRQSFLDAHPDVVQQVVRAYERARLWAIGHHDDLVKILVNDEKISPTVASRQLERVDFANPAPGDALRQSLSGSFDVLKANGLVPPDTDLQSVTKDLIEPRFTDALGKDG